MAVARSSLAELTRLVDRCAAPVWVLDAAWRIVAVNGACCRWLGVAADALLGMECRYHSSPDFAQGPALADALCPPPRAMAGQACRAVVVPPADPGQRPDGAEEAAAADARLVEFQPLLEDAERVLAVICIAALESAAPEQAEPASESSDALHRRLAHFRRKLRELHGEHRLVGDSPAIQRVRAQVKLAAGSKASVLIVGPPGSGRRRVAGAIHSAADQQSTSPMVPLSCKLLGAELMQATLRGLARVITDAPPQRPATLLLLDADQMPREAQLELAGILTRADLPLRVVSLAEVPLDALAARGEFHAELAALLCTLIIDMPPLAQRLDDLPLLAQAMVEELNTRGDKQVAGLSREALEQLAAYHWPGGMEELEQVIGQAHGAATMVEIMPADLPRRIFLSEAAARRAATPMQTIVLEEFLAQVERELLERALIAAKGNKAKAARLLGMTRPKLYRRLQQLGIIQDDAPAGEQPAEE